MSFLKPELARLRPLVMELVDQILESNLVHIFRIDYPITRLSSSSFEDLYLNILSTTSWNRSGGPASRRASCLFREKKLSNHCPNV